MRFFKLSLVLFLFGCGPSPEEIEKSSNDLNENESSSISFSPRFLQDCNRTYYETEYETTWTSTKDASLKYNRWSGRITYSPPSTKENTAKIAWGMNASKFFEHCSSGNIGVWSSACSHFQQCVSVVKNRDMNNQDFILLDYQGTAEFLKETLYPKGKTEARENCIGNNCRMTVDNITQACDVVSRTYSATTVGDSIFKNIPELDYAKSQELGVNAVKGYGTCMCVLHNAINIKDDMSIGYCEGDKYFDY